MSGTAEFFLICGLFGLVIAMFDIAKAIREGNERDTIGMDVSVPPPSSFHIYHNDKKIEEYTNAD